jgi:hypothetical protein
LRIALTTLLFPIHHQASDAYFNHQASVADPAPVPVQICHPSCRGPSHGRNQTRGQRLLHTYRMRQVDQLSRQLSAASQSNGVVSQEHHSDLERENRVGTTLLSAVTRAPKCRSVQSSKGPTLAYARARNSAIKTGTVSAHDALQGIVFYMKSVQSIIGATDRRCASYLLALTLFSSVLVTSRSGGFYVILRPACSLGCGCVRPSGPSGLPKLRTISHKTRRDATAVRLRHGSDHP